MMRSRLLLQGSSHVGLRGQTISPQNKYLELMLGEDSGSPTPPDVPLLRDIKES